MPIVPYVDIEYVGLIAPIPAKHLYAFEENHPGSFAAIALSVSRMFDARLSKRYAVPFDQADPPEALRFHVANVVAYNVWLKIGFDPGSEQDAYIKEARDESLAWLKEAADSEAGTVELPRKEADPVPAQSAITRSGPKSISDPSPFTWVSRQRDRVRGLR